MSNENFVESEDNLQHHCNPFYAAPERLGDQRYGKEVDIWSMYVKGTVLCICSKQLVIHCLI